MTEPSIENLKAAAEELKKTEANPVRGQQGLAEAQREQTSNGAKELTPNPETDLIQEKIKLEKILQELNDLKSKICQRIGLIKTIIKDNDFSNQIKKRFEDVREKMK